MLLQKDMLERRIWQVWLKDRRDWSLKSPKDLSRGHVTNKNKQANHLFSCCSWCWECVQNNTEVSQAGVNAKRRCWCTNLTRGPLPGCTRFNQGAHTEWGVCAAVTSTQVLLKAEEISSDRNEAHIKSAYMKEFSHISCKAFLRCVSTFIHSMSWVSCH